MDSGLLIFLSRQKGFCMQSVFPFRVQIGWQHSGVLPSRLRASWRSQAQASTCQMDICFLLKHVFVEMFSLYRSLSLSQRISSLSTTIRTINKNLTVKEWIRSQEQRCGCICVCLGRFNQQTKLNTKLWFHPQGVCIYRFTLVPVFKHFTSWCLECDENAVAPQAVRLLSVKRGCQRAECSFSLRLLIKYVYPIVPATPVGVNPAGASQR